VIAAAIVIARLPTRCRPAARSGSPARSAGFNPVSFTSTSTAGTTLGRDHGGFFLQLSYFGTDQSQSRRYLSRRSVAEMRLGLLFNGMFKVPMQFLILFIGVMVFVFFPVHPARRCTSTRPLARVEAPALRGPCAGGAVRSRVRGQRSAAIAYLTARGRRRARGPRPARRPPRGDRPGPRQMPSS